MTRKKEENNNNTHEQVLKNLNKEYGTKDKDEFFLSTGSLKLDAALGGKGIVSGRITELLAWEGSGKTTLCLHLVAEAQKAGLYPAYIDSEHALDKRYAEAIGVDWDDLMPKDEDKRRLFQPMDGEKAFMIAEELLKAGKVKLIIFDSTSGMIPESQFIAEPGGSNMGKHALLFSKEIPKINSLAAKHNAIVVFVSQLREKIGVMYGSPETTQAGNALKFFASNRIKLQKAIDKDGTEIVGIVTKFTLLKCKTSSPYVTGSFPILFGKGIDKLSEILEVAEEFKIIDKAGSWYSYGEVRLGQGLKSAKALLENNPELMQEIEGKVRARLSEGESITLDTEI